MTINGKEIKSIRPMTEKEKKEYINDVNLTDSIIFCIEFIDGNILLPKDKCINCMLEDKCLFTLVSKMP